VVEVRPLSAAVATGDVQHLSLRFLGTVVAPIDRAAGASEMRKGRRHPEALCRRGRNEAVECRATIVIERIHSASQRVIMEMLGSDPRGDEALCGLILKKQRDEGAWLVHKAEPMEDHRFDGVAHGDNAGLWIGLHGPVKPIANTKFATQRPRWSKTSLQYGWCIGGFSREEIVPTHHKYSNRLGGLRNVGWHHIDPRFLTRCTDNGADPFRDLPAQHLVAILGDPDNSQMDGKDYVIIITIVTYIL
jgi:hypothetical protein